MSATAAVVPMVACRQSARSGPTAKRQNLKRRLAEEQSRKASKAPPPQEEEEDDYQSDGDDSVQSMKQKHGKREEDNEKEVAYNGCVCGVIHARPIKVFWIGCDGPCEAWFNVRSKCVDGLTSERAEHCDWYCRDCTAQLQKESQPLKHLLDLPQEVLYRVLEFVAPPTYRAGVLQQQIAPLSKTARHFVQGDKSKGLWEAILQREYLRDQKKQPHQPSSVATLKAEFCDPQYNRRSSKRQRKQTNFLSPCPSTQNDHPRHAVKEQHVALLQRTEDAYYILEELADPLNAYTRIAQTQEVLSKKNKKQSTTLTLHRLRRVLQQHQPIDANRPSPCTGRTLLQVVCAGEMAEGVIVSCVQHLLDDYQADPNALTRNEAPFADRPALYFAIARAMPNLVQTLVDAGACLETSVSGKWKMTFDTSREIEGEFTPLQYAQVMKQVEVIDMGAESKVPPYWVAKLNTMIRQLDAATEGQQRKKEEQERVRKLQAAEFTARAKRAAGRLKPKRFVSNKEGKRIGCV